MKWFYDLKIRLKLLASFVLVAMIAGAVGVVGISNIRKANIAADALYTKDTVSTSILGDVGMEFQRVRVNVHKLVLARNESEQKMISDAMKKLTSQISANLRKYEKLISSKEEQKAYDRFQDTRKPYIANYGDGLPTRRNPGIERKFLYNPEYPGEKNNQIYLDEMKYAEPMVPSPFISDSDMNAITSLEFDRMWLGKQSADRACDNIARRINAIIRRNLANPNFLD